MWFEQLTGFQEKSPEQVRSNIEVSGNTLTSKVNGKSYVCGKLEVPTLAELKILASKCHIPKGSLTLKEVVGDVQKLHTDSCNAKALFQAASQFNLLEMMNPSVSPEAGVGIYSYDYTQGPACAIAAGAGTIYRNYFVEVNGQIGQSLHNQIDCLKDLGKALENDNNRLWAMRNGYALATMEGLREISSRLQSLNESERDELRTQLRIGLQWDTQVTFNDCQHLVSQAYCSAMPVAYSPHSAELWADFAKLILEATYEATLAAATLNFEKTGNPKVFLTLVGGGAFGNAYSWIFAALRRALDLYAYVPLEVAIVSYGRSSERVRKFVKEITS